MTLLDGTKGPFTPTRPKKGLQKTFYNVLLCVAVVDVVIEERVFSAFVQRWQKSVFCNVEQTFQ